MSQPRTLLARSHRRDNWLLAAAVSIPVSLLVVACMALVETITGP